MARKTLAAKYESYDAALSLQRQILCYNKDVKEVYYDVEPQLEEPAAPSVDASAPTAAATPSSSLVAAAPIAAPPSSGPAVQVADEPVKAVEIVRVIVAQKLKKQVSEVPGTMAIKDLVNG